MTIRVIAIGALATLLSGCGSTASIDRLSSVLIGEFSSAEQAQLDPDNYFDIRLNSVQIWAGRDDGAWLYVEQASAEALDRPYRQRVYRLSKSDRRFVSDVYTMPDPLTYAGWYATPELDRKSVV